MLGEGKSTSLIVWLTKHMGAAVTTLASQISLLREDIVKKRLEIQKATQGHVLIRNSIGA